MKLSKNFYSKVNRKIVSLNITRKKALQNGNKHIYQVLSNQLVGIDYMIQLLKNEKR